jgi:hypothetical protein
MRRDPDTTGRRAPFALWTVPRWPSFHRVVPLTALLLGALLMPGCAKSPAEPELPGSDPGDPVNSDAPNANARILSQQVIGESDPNSVILGIEVADAASAWFRGGVGGSWVVGRLSPTGGLLFRTPLTYLPRGLVALSASSPLPGGAIVVGGRDIDGDGRIDVSYATLLAPTGGIIAERSYASDSSEVSLFAIAPLSDSLFVVAGGERTQTRLNPLMALLALTDGDSLQNRQQVVISSLAGQGAAYVATDPGDALASRRRIYLSTIASGGSHTITVHGVDIDASTLAPWSLAWTRTLTGKGVGTQLYDMQVVDGALYVAGSANDPDKGGPINGLYWTSGLTARLSLAGDVVWAKVVRVTAHSDMFWGLAPTADAILALGEAASYIASPNKAFGYGWIAHLGPSDGETLSSLTFGDPGFDSGFCAGTGPASALQMGGWTEHVTPNGPRRVWSCVVNASPAGPMVTSRSPAAARAGEVPVGGDGPAAKRE